MNEPLLLSPLLPVFRPSPRGPASLPLHNTILLEKRSPKETNGNTDFDGDRCPLHTDLAWVVLDDFIIPCPTASCIEAGITNARTTG